MPGGARVDNHSEIGRLGTWRGDREPLRHPRDWARSQSLPELLDNWILAGGAVSAVEEPRPH